jgi:hypothetical protein
MVLAYGHNYYGGRRITIQGQPRKSMRCYLENKLKAKRTEVRLKW